MTMIALLLLAAPSCSTVLHLDQLRGTLTMTRAGESRSLDPDKELSLRSDEPLCFEVTDTSTALYRYEIQAAEFDTLGSQSLPGPPEEKVGAYVAAVADAFKGFAVASDDAKSAAGATRGGSEDVIAAARALDKTRDEIDALVFGDDGVEDSAFRAQAALVQMSFRPESTDDIVKKLHATLDPRLTCAPGGTGIACAKYLAVLDRLADAYGELESHILDLERAVAGLDDTQRKPMEAAVTKWREYRGAFVTTLGHAREADALVRGALDSKGTWRSDAYRSTWHSGEKVVLSVTPKGQAKAEKSDTTGADQAGAQPSAGLPLAPSRVVRVRLLPASGVHFSAGLCGLFVPGARFSTYDTVAGSGGTKTIVKSGDADHRIGFALALGVGWDKLDGREKSGFALWLPELLVNPADDGGTLGVGGALSWRVLKLGAGAAFIRHASLVHQKVGQSLPSTEALQQSQGYDPSRPLPYVSLAVFTAF